MERQVFRLTKKTGHVELAPQTRRRHDTDACRCFQPQALERDRSGRVSRGVLGREQS